MDYRFFNRPFAMLLLAGALGLAGCQQNMSDAGETPVETTASADTSAQINTLTDAERGEGWQLLFNGQNLDGWESFNADTVGQAWKVQDGVLYLDSQKKPDGGWQVTGGGDIVTEQAFEDFDLQLEWRIAECGNSGIMYYVVENPQFDQPWKTGPEMQILDNSCHPDAKITKHRAGDLYDLIEGDSTAVNPAGEWNEVRIVSNDGKVEHWLNGKKLLDYDRNSEAYRQLIAGSKFKDMQGFGVQPNGKIALQDHGDPVFFRNIKIRNLN